MNFSQLEEKLDNLEVLVEFILDRADVGKTFQLRMETDPVVEEKEEVRDVNRSSPCSSGSIEIQVRFSEHKYGKQPEGKGS